MHEQRVHGGLRSKKKKTCPLHLHVKVQPGFELGQANLAVIDIARYHLSLPSQKPRPTTGSQPTGSWRRISGHQGHSSRWSTWDGRQGQGTARTGYYYKQTGPVFTLACSAMLESINSWDRCFAKDSSASFYQQLDGLTALR